MGENLSFLLNFFVHRNSSWTACVFRVGMRISRCHAYFTRSLSWLPIISLSFVCAFWFSIVGSLFTGLLSTFSLWFASLSVDSSICSPSLDVDFWPYDRWRISNFCFFTTKNAYLSWHALFRGGMRISSIPCSTLYAYFTRSPSWLTGTSLFFRMRILI